MDQIKEVVSNAVNEDLANVLREKGYIVTNNYDIRNRYRETKDADLNFAGLYSIFDLYDREVTEYSLKRLLTSCRLNRKQIEKLCDEFNLICPDLYSVHPKLNDVPPYASDEELVRYYENYLNSTEVIHRWLCFANKLSPSNKMLSVYKMTWDLETNTWQSNSRLIGKTRAFPYNWLYWGYKHKRIPYKRDYWKSELESLAPSIKWPIILHYGYNVPIEKILQVAKTPVEDVSMDIMTFKLHKTISRKPQMGENIYKTLLNIWFPNITKDMSDEIILNKIKSFYMNKVQIEFADIQKIKSIFNSNIDKICTDSKTITRLKNLNINTYEQFLEYLKENNLEKYEKAKDQIRSAFIFACEGEDKTPDIFLSGVDRHMLKQLFRYGYRTKDELIADCYSGEIDELNIRYKKEIKQYAKDLAKKNLVVDVVCIDQTG